VEASPQLAVCCTSIQRARLVPVDWWKSHAPVIPVPLISVVCLSVCLPCTSAFLTRFVFDSQPFLLRTRLHCEHSHSACVCFGNTQVSSCSTDCKRWKSLFSKTTSNL
jgi:hypothetical protein